MSRTDLQNDLLADLQGEVSARPLPATAPALPPLPSLLEPPARPTPAIDVRLTPLRWARPQLAPTQGLGLGLRVGPVQVSWSLGA
jgi:hypothetical protein